MTKDELIALAKSIAWTFDLYPEIVCAIVERESSWNPNVPPRYEPAYKVKYIDKLGLSEPEATDRATSWGLMQLMGESARESGYSGSIPALQDPELGLAWGCRWLERKLVHAGGNVETALLLWNGGSNHQYPTEVMAMAEKYKDTPNAPSPDAPSSTEAT